MMYLGTGYGFPNLIEIRRKEENSSKIIIGVRGSHPAYHHLVIKPWRERSAVQWHFFASEFEGGRSGKRGKKAGGNLKKKGGRMIINPLGGTVKTS